MIGMVAFALNGRAGGAQVPSGPLRRHPGQRSLSPWAAASSGTSSSAASRQPCSRITATCWWRVVTALLVFCGGCDLPGPLSRLRDQGRGPGQYLRRPGPRRLYRGGRPSGHQRRLFPTTAFCWSSWASSPASAAASSGTSSSCGCRWCCASTSMPCRSSSALPSTLLCYRLGAPQLVTSGAVIFTVFVLRMLATYYPLESPPTPRKAANRSAQNYKNIRRRVSPAADSFFILFSSGRSAKSAARPAPASAGPARGQSARRRPGRGP